MRTPLVLPAGYRARPATLADVPAIGGLLGACEHALLGRAETDLDAVAAPFARPGFDPELDTSMVFDPADVLVARAWVKKRCEVDVHPRHRGRGLGGALLDWVEARARRDGTPQLTQTVPDEDEAAVALLRSRGFEPIVVNWRLEIALPTEPEVPEPPPGITVRPFRAGDGPAAHQLLEDAFQEWGQRRRSYTEWAALTVGRTSFAPDVSPVAFAGDQMIGAVLALDVPGTTEGYIERLAVRHDHRGRGVARLLLRDTFRGFFQRGRLGCTLWTHSRTGALALYERVGMSVGRSTTAYAKIL
ncbi:GNAT family N-acetyltransferase [Longispora sp. NPDC051575]|uniref:GNAT family N-acetyltransferase n=1 Tax=Longispora sp. NPDC051575 TaxID=3154943 RepID=UPI003427BF74